MHDALAWHRAFDAANAPVSAFEFDVDGVVGIAFRFGARLTRWPASAEPVDRHAGINRCDLVCRCGAIASMAIHATDEPIKVLERVHRKLASCPRCARRRGADAPDR